MESLDEDDISRALEAVVWCEHRKSRLTGLGGSNTRVAEMGNATVRHFQGADSKHEKHRGFLVLLNIET